MFLKAFDTISIRGLKQDQEYWMNDKKSGINHLKITTIKRNLQTKTSSENKLQILTISLKFHKL